MSVRLGLLAILDQAPCYGYQLRTELDRRTGSRGPINVGQIYNTLDRLERDKLVRKAGETNYYEITELGSRVVADWFSSASPTPELAAKIALAATLRGVDAREVVRIQRESLAAVEPAGVRPGDAETLAASIVVAADVEAAAAQLRLLDHADRLLALGVAPLPLSTEKPKRGRPAKASS